MTLLGYIRRIRHGPLRMLGPLWVRLGTLYRWIARIAGVTRPVSHYIGSYGPFAMDSEFAFSNFESWGGGHNNGFEQCVEACRGVSCVLDIGAHIGLVSMPVSQVLAPGGNVYAFEPAQVNLGYLHKHIDINGINNVKVVEQLVGEVNQDRVKFFEQRVATGQNSMVVKKNHEAYFETHRPQTTLDTFCSKQRLLPEVIKIDVEGAEWDVLKGGDRVLTESLPKIFLSVHPVELKLMGKSTEQLLRLIDELGFELLEMDGSRPEVMRLAEYLMQPKSCN